MKEKTVYECTECGARSTRWLGRCQNCGAWNSLVETTVAASGPKTQKPHAATRPRSKVFRLGEIDAEANYRIITGIKELDRALGGGIIPGSLVLIGGDPGIGKSTLLLQMCGRLESENPLYVSGEESLQQIRYRSSRMTGISDSMQLLAETEIEQIEAVIRGTDCGLVIIDSIQSVYSSYVDSTPGSVSQVRECTTRFMQIAKQTNKPIFIVGHVTKEGAIAGPKMLEHMVDTVLQFEGERTYSYRIMRAIKNRFGSTNEIGIFEMGEDGLQEVANPSAIFLGGREQDESGVAIVASIEGSRPILLEVQALVTPTSYGMPQRTANGFDMRRLQMIIAVLEKRLGVVLRHSDVFVNVAGGVYLNDPSVDLGIAAALVSSLRDAPIDAKTVIIGEIGLTGEVRHASALAQRLSEAEKLGFSRAIAPKSSMGKLPRKYDLNVMPVDRISVALAQII